MQFSLNMYLFSNTFNSWCHIDTCFPDGDHTGWHQIISPISGEDVNKNARIGGKMMMIAGILCLATPSHQYWHQAAYIGGEVSVKFTM